ncbi:MAG: hypothetical protein JWO08_2860 [Verrucomicrobiaceae bacterium]|nr:hypothetical protein [Verrucomicrobiaceae bacterium]
MVIWNVSIGAQMFLHYPRVQAPGPLMGVLLAVFCAFALGTLRFPWLQALLLKPGRSIGEVRTQLLFVGVLLGVMALAFSLRLGVRGG